MEPVSIVSTITITKKSAERFLKDNAALFAEEMIKIADGDLLIIQYIEKTQTLFFIYWLELRNVESMINKPEFKIFREIINFKDICDIDYIVFSSSAPNFMSDPIWLAYRVEKKKLTEIDGNAIPEKKQLYMNELVNKFIFDFAAKHSNELDVAENPYNVFLNKKNVHPILVEECKKRCSLSK